ncbi:cupredoxin domain-containing protein [Natrinema salifodinae]|uniref:Plastocyanin n=1 Tax=Natrinema salifodinae TaxID=1202768 RepID=A0A1I0Q390_9EURY|nr:cupredoxin domain-containing protein [Natrinema salifodinae]SEW21248.1 Plastocyanin [Natrinema salifodinae]
MGHYRRWVLRLTGGTVAAALAGCTGGGEPSIERTTAVTMADAQFDPRNAAVETGATVTWTNEDDTAHTVTSASDDWTKDAEVAAGEETTHTFEADGVYDVYCRFDGDADLSGMSMKVGVGDAAIEDPLGDDDGSGGGYYRAE